MAYTPPKSTLFISNPIRLTPSGVPANAVVQRDGTVVTQRDGQIVVDQRP